MSQGKEIITTLEKAIHEKDFDSVVRLGKDGGYLFEWNSSEVTVKGGLLQEDSIGVMVNWLELEKDARQVESSYLKTAAEAIEKRVNYLLEPLRIIEVDSTMNAVQMRSEKPEVGEGNIAYFELILKSGKWFGHRNHLSLRRYSQRPDDEPNRRVIAFPLTKRQLEKLFDDFIEAL